MERESCGQDTLTDTPRSLPACQRRRRSSSRCRWERGQRLEASRSVPTPTRSLCGSWAPCGRSGSGGACPSSSDEASQSPRAGLGGAGTLESEEGGYGLDNWAGALVQLDEELAGIGQGQVGHFDMVDNFTL